MRCSSFPNSRLRRKALIFVLMFNHSGAHVSGAGAETACNCGVGAAAFCACCLGLVGFALRCSFRLFVTRSIGCNRQLEIFHRFGNQLLQVGREPLFTTYSVASQRARHRPALAAILPFAERYRWRFARWPVFSSP